MHVEEISVNIQWITEDNYLWVIIRKICEFRQCTAAVNKTLLTSLNLKNKTSRKSQTD